MVGKPTLSVKELSHTKGASTWELLGIVTYAKEGTYGISVVVHDKTGHLVVSGGGKVQFNVANAPLTNATPKKTYKAVKDKATGSKVLAVFKDGNPKAKLSDYHCHRELGRHGGRHAHRFGQVGVAKHDSIHVGVLRSASIQTRVATPFRSPSRTSAARTIEHGQNHL